MHISFLFVQIYIYIYIYLVTYRRTNMHTCIHVYPHTRINTCTENRYAHTLVHVHTSTQRHGVVNLLLVWILSAL